MVNWLNQVVLTGTALLAQQQQQTQSALQRMSPEQRAKVLAAFAAFVILGLGLIALAWLGARVTRRYMNPRPIRRREYSELQDDWSQKPLAPPEPKRIRREDSPPE
jgi:hypothetical protein